MNIYFQLIYFLVSLSLFSQQNQVADSNSKHQANTIIGDSTMQINYTDPSGKKQGHWVFFGKDRDYPGYDSEQIVEDGYYTDGRKTGVWKKYYSNGLIEHEINFMNGRPNGYVVFYTTDGRVSEEGTWKNNRWIGDYKFYHENGNLAYEWNYNHMGKREGTQKYYHKNGQVMIEGDWNNGKESGTITRYFSDGSVKAIRYFNDGKVDSDSTQTFEAPDGVDDEILPISPNNTETSQEVEIYTPSRDTVAKEDSKEQKIVKEDKNEVENVGFFDGNGFYRLMGPNGKVAREGTFKRGFLMDGKIYRYDSHDKLTSTIIYKNGKVIDEIIHHDNSDTDTLYNEQ